MSQNWGAPNQGQQWPGQQSWNRPPTAWGSPVPQQSQYPQTPQPGPQGQYPPTGQPASQYAQSGQTAPQYAQPGQPAPQYPQAGQPGRAYLQPGSYVQSPPAPRPPAPYPQPSPYGQRPPSGQPMPPYAQPGPYSQQPQQAYRAPQQVAPPAQPYLQQPAYGLASRYAPAPARRKSPVAAVLGGSLFVLVVAFFGVAMMSLMSPVATDPPITEPSTQQVTNVPEPDFNPPAIPVPETVGEAKAWMNDNALYSQKVPVPTNCAVPYLDSTTASPTRLEEHLNQLTACLWGVWEGPMASADFKLPRPPVTVYTTEITTPCGKALKGNAFYCGADQQIYYSQDLYRVLPKAIRTKPFVPEMVMAHEFGHAIQARIGLLISEKYFEQQGTPAQARVYSRRTEVQADCLSGLFTNAVAKASELTDSDFENLKYLANGLGDDVLTGKPGYDGDHGSGKARKAWFSTGLSNSAITKCNTFVVPASQVR